MYRFCEWLVEMYEVFAPGPIHALQWHVCDVALLEALSSDAGLRGVGTFL